MHFKLVCHTLEFNVSIFRIKDEFSLQLVYIYCSKIIMDLTDIWVIVDAS